MTKTGTGTRTKAGPPPRLGSSRRQLLRTSLLGLPAAGAVMLGLPAGGLVSANAQTGAAPNAFPDGVQITVAGPEGGDLDSWSRILVPALGSYLSPNTSIRRGLAGGIDGITGATQFAAQALPDGSSALLAPGSTLFSWLRGDQRVPADMRSWIPLLSGLCTIVIAGRIGSAPLTSGQKLRVGVSGPNGIEMAVVLGLELLGLMPIPVAGVVDQASAEAAFAQHSVDLLLLRGPAIAATLATSEVRPLCVLGMPDAQAGLGRDPSLLDLPHLGELLNGAPNTQLANAWRAAAVAAQTVFTLMLPQLTATALVLRWRHAVEQAIVTPELLAMATAQATRLQANPDAIGATITAPEAASALRAWFAERQRR